LRRISELKEQRMTEEQRQLHIEKHHNWFSSPSRPTVRRINKNDIGLIREVENAYKIFVQISEGNISFGRPTCKGIDIFFRKIM
jgi:hypothetical protein